MERDSFASSANFSCEKAMVILSKDELSISVSELPDVFVIGVAGSPSVKVNA